MQNNPGQMRRLEDSSSSSSSSSSSEIMLDPSMNASCSSSESVIPINSNRIKLALDVLTEGKNQGTRKRFRRFNNVHRVKPMDTLMAESCKKRRRFADLDTDCQFVAQHLQAKKSKVQIPLDFAQIGDRLERLGSAMKEVAKQRAGPIKSSERVELLGVVDSVVHEVVDGVAHPAEEIGAVMELVDRVGNIHLDSDTEDSD